MNFITAMERFAKKAATTDLVPCAALTSLSLRWANTLVCMNDDRRPDIAFLGTGSMSGAILVGLLAQRELFGVLSATTRSASSAAGLDHDGIRAVSLEAEPEANQRLAAEADVVILGVKPPQIVDLARDIAQSLRPGAVVVSVAAGISTAAIEAVLPESVRGVRVMPNTPSHVGLGVSGIAAGASADDAAVRVTKRIFDVVGDALVIDESQIDALSAISGSGPAYVFLFIEQWSKVAVSLGFTDEQAATMVAGTFRGASELLAASDAEPAELRRRVTSPKGTTEQAVGVLQSADLEALFARAADAAIARARELAG